MIFNKNNLILVNNPRGYRLYQYKYSDNPESRGIEVMCNAGSPMGPRRGYTYWDCGIRIWDLDNVAVGKFSMSAPWNDKKFFTALETFMNNGGKQKLIGAIYNDFEA